MTEDQRLAAEWAREAGATLSAFAASSPDFAEDTGTWEEYEEALTQLASAYYRTTHSGIGLVSGELLAAALPSLAMRLWDAAAELARVGAAYAEVEVASIEKGGGMYDYATVPYTLATIGPVDWYAPDLSADALPELVANAKSIAAIARAHWVATRQAPVEEWPDEPDQSAILEQLSEACSTLDAAGAFAYAARPPLQVLLDATVASVVRRSWATVYPFAAATAVLAEYESHRLDVDLGSDDAAPGIVDSAFTAEEQARREAIVKAMLAERDKRRPMSLQEVLQARDEGRP